MAVKPRGNDATGDSYEAHLEALDKVIADLEGDALSLEATIDRYKEGVAHLGSCRKILDAAEKRLAELVTSADGGVEERPLEVGAEGLVDAGRGPGTRDASGARPPTARTRIPSENGEGAARGKPAAGAATAPVRRTVVPQSPLPQAPQEVGDDLPF